jgi:hypothetical protein
MSCSANSDYLTLPSYFQSENKYEIALPTDKFLQSYNMTSWKIWEPFHSTFPNFTLIDLPEKLKETKTIPVDDLIREIGSIQDVPILDNGWPTWVYVLIGFVGSLTLGIIIFVYCRYYKKCTCKSKSMYWLSRKGRSKYGISANKTVSGMAEHLENGHVELNKIPSAPIMRMTNVPGQTAEKIQNLPVMSPAILSGEVKIKETETDDPNKN